jgi:hypothetical protein
MASERGNFASGAYVEGRSRFPHDPRRSKRFRNHAVGRTVFDLFDASKTGILAKEAVGSNYRSTWSSSGAGMCS